MAARFSSSPEFRYYTGWREQTHSTPARLVDPKSGQGQTASHARVTRQPVENPLPISAFVTDDSLLASR
jgi:hypothetical protein